jgi:hypothetical protein
MRVGVFHSKNRSSLLEGDFWNEKANAAVGRIEVSLLTLGHPRKAAGNLQRRFLE